MPPIAQSAVKFKQRINNTKLRRLTLKLIHEATKQPDLAHFTVAMCKNPSHTSRSDRRPHVTVILATEEQAKANKCHIVHIYHNDDENYLGHLIYPEKHDDDIGE